MMIEYIKGDLFTTDCKYIAHGVNCQGVMGAGVAKIVKERFPKAFRTYYNHCSTQDFQSSLLGNVCISPKENDKVILNCFTQDFYGRNGSYVSYDALVNCFDAISFADISELAMPKIGAGLGGGDWSIIEAIINSKLIKKGIKVKVYEL
jgi:O-acetyl-ADP-ribose deacetylase (regulator of RNase III)